jgi:hypothetical protein
VRQGTGENFCKHVRTRPGLGRSTISLPRDFTSKISHQSPSTTCYKTFTYTPMALQNNQRGRLRSGRCGRHSAVSSHNSRTAIETTKSNATLSKSHEGGWISSWGRLRRIGSSWGRAAVGGKEERWVMICDISIYKQ